MPSSLRPRLRRNFSGLLALVSLAGIFSPLRAAPAPWLKLETAEFVVYSDAPEKQVVECALRYAAFRRAFADLFLEPGRTLPPSTFLLFRKEKSFHDLTPPATEKNTKLVNYSIEVDGTPLTAFSLAGDRDRALEMTFEFETIWALRRIGHFVPLWVSQGAGEVLSTVTLAKGKCLIGEDTGHSFDDAFDWPRFFDLNEDSKAYREAGPELSQYLQQAWGLMHWILLDDAGTRARFESLEQHLRTDAGIDVVPAVMNTPVNHLSKAIRRHSTKPRAIPFDEAAIKAAFQLSPAPEAEVVVQTSNLLCATDRVYECNLALDQARALAPDLAIVKEAWARRMLRESRDREAVEFYRDAIAAGSKNFAAYYKSATTRLNDNMSRGADHAGDGGPESLKAIVELRRALQLNPGSASTYRLLGRAFYVAPTLTDADIAELSAGVTRGDDGQLVRYYRALLHSRLHHREECARDFRAILADPDISNQFRQSAQHQFVQEIVSADAKQVERFARDHDYAAAFELIVAGEKEPEPELVEAYRRLRTWLTNLVRADSDATPGERKLAGLD